MLSGDYVINGTTIPCPSMGRWLPRRPLDVQGDNRPIYAPVRAFELTWEIQFYEDWGVLIASFEDIQSTGTAVVELPAYPTATGQAFAFQEYSGATLGEPVVGEFFHQEFPMSISLIIGNIRTQ